MLRFLYAAFLFLAVSPAYAADNGGYIGERECFACHKDIKADYAKDRHGRVFTSAPNGELQSRGCEACHGPGAEHVDAVDREDLDLRIQNFRPGKGLPADANARCLACHDNVERGFWKGSRHELSGMNCAGCHNIHAEEARPAMDVCFSCHQERRAQLQRSSHMPLREGKMTCSSCHNPHGGPGPSALKQASVNENCYACHQEKRGPLVWEHAPVRENCANCHDPHGSNYESLLKVKNPNLCQTCHTGGHGGNTPFDASSISTANKRLLGKGCLNCHSQVHGSNHPSGARFQR